MKVFLTGASGTLGGYIIRELLSAGHEISVYDIAAPSSKEVKFIKGDILDEESTIKSCTGHDAVIHMAAIPGPGRATLQGMLNLNVIGTANVIEAAFKSGINKFVFASSASASGFTFQKNDFDPDYLPIDENHPSKPQDEYGLSKLMGEALCKRYTDAFGMQTISLRINHNWYLDRDGAELSVGTGWAKNLETVEDLWEQRYYKVIEKPDSDWPVPGPPSPKKILWVYTDARDAAQAFRLAVENETIKNDMFYINADDTCSKTKTSNLLREHFPNVEIKSQLNDFASLVSHDKATKILGYKPNYNWRETDFGNWLANKVV